MIIIPDFARIHPSSNFFVIFLALSRASCIDCHTCNGLVSPLVRNVQNSPSVTVPKISIQDNYYILPTSSSKTGSCNAVDRNKC